MTEEGYQVSSAGEGKGALRRITEELPDLVLLDLRLPDMHGLDVLKRVKEQEAEVPVIIMTAFGDVESAVRAMKLGAHDYINKPINLSTSSSPSTRRWRPDPWRAQAPGPEPGPIRP
jgi:DNA-binding NtrC family response regulator